MTKHDNVSREGIMKATEFVKKFRWDLVAEHLESAPESATVISGLTCQFFKQDDNSPVWSRVYYSNGNECSVTRFSPIISPIEIEDLKRLIKSRELIADYYGLSRAKEHADSEYTAPELKDALKQAIADVEACQ